MTKDYYGTKRVTAWRADRSQTEVDEIAGRTGEGYGVKYADGYISWSPREAFEAAYQPIDAMSFGHALAAVKEGHSVARAGWNGKGMCIYLHRGVAGKNILDAGPVSGIPASMFDPVVADMGTRLPSIAMRTASGAVLVGWLASQNDMLAHDWTIVE